MKPTEKLTPEDHALDSFFYNRCLLALGDGFFYCTFFLLTMIGVLGGGVFHGLRLAKSSSYTHIDSQRIKRQKGEW